MEDPIAALDERKEVCRNRPAESVNRSGWKSSRLDFPFSPSAESVERKSQSPVKSSEAADKEYFPNWGNVGEVSPPNSKCSDIISAGLRSGEMSPVFDLPSDGVGSLEKETTRSNLSESLNSLHSEGLPEVKISSSSPLNSSMRTSSKESSFSSSNFSPVEGQINHTHHIREEHFVDADWQKTEHPASTTRLASPHLSTPNNLGRMKLNPNIKPGWFHNGIERAKGSTRTRLVINSVSNSSDNPNIQPGEPNSSSMTDLWDRSVSNRKDSYGLSEPFSTSNVVSKKQLMVSIQSKRPSMCDSNFLGSQNNGVNGLTGSCNKTIEELLSSWEAFLRQLKNNKQTPTDFVKSIEAYLQQTKAEVGVNTNDPSVASNGDNNIDVNKFQNKGPDNLNSGVADQPGDEMKGHPEEVCFRKVGNIYDKSKTKTIAITEDSSREDVMNLNHDLYACKSVLNSKDILFRTNLKRNNPPSKLSSEKVGSTVDDANKYWSNKDYEHSEKIEQLFFARLHTSANPNKGNLNHSSCSNPKMKRTSNIKLGNSTSHPGRECTILDADDSRAILNPCPKEGDIDKLNIVNEHLLNQIDSQEHLALRATDSRKNTLEEASEVPAAVLKTPVKNHCLEESRKLP